MFATGSNDKTIKLWRPSRQTLEHICKDYWKNQENKKDLTNFIACFNFKILLRSYKPRLIQKFQWLNLVKIVYITFFKAKII
jgi:hypothetical protein